jgi:hypothetical protein
MYDHLTPNLLYLRVPITSVLALDKIPVSIINTAHMTHHNQSTRRVTCRVTHRVARLRRRNLLNKIVSFSVLLEQFIRYCYSNYRIAYIRLIM